jgi:hypothetical protein
MADSYGEDALEAMVAEYRADFAESIESSGLRISDTMGVLFVGNREVGVALFDRSGLETCFSDTIAKCQTVERDETVEVLIRAKQEALEFWEDPAAGLLRVLVVALNTGEIMGVRLGIHDGAAA